MARCIIEPMTDLFILRGVPAYIRSDNGPLAIVLEPMAHKLASLLRPSAIGLRRSALKPPTLSLARLGRTDTAKVSTQGFGMNC